MCILSILNSIALGRVFDPLNELRSLDDYRKRHAQYKSDPDAQAMHAAMPMIAVWDDHEFANNSYRDGAEDHDPNLEGTWESRRAAAIQAYHEWMPIRTGSSKEIIYRGFDFGDLASLHMLDTRIARDKPLKFTDQNFLLSLTSPTREMLGAAQTAWLEERLENSTGKWQILGQQVLMARIESPLSLLQYIGDNGVENPSDFAAAINNYLIAKGTPVSLLTPAQQDLLNTTKNPKFGYNLDAWDGYPFARGELLSFIAQAFDGRDRKLVALAGDTHNAWHSNVTAEGPAGLTKVGVEFATPSVTSPGFEEYLKPIPPEQLNMIFPAIIDDLEWIDTSQRGYLLLTVISTQVKADWVFVSSVSKKDFTSAINHTATTA
jgi:alkaline phosphatase D